MKVGEEKIIESAYALFKQRGIRSTSMQHIAQASGTSFGIVKVMFKSKKELVLAIVRHTVDKKTAHMLINSSLSPSAVTELNTFFKFVDATLGAFGADLFGELKRYHPHVLDQLKDIVDETLIPFLRKNMQRGFIEGFYREAVDAELYASTYFYILRIVLENGNDWTPTMKAIAQINDIFLHGALNAKGMRV